MGKSHWGLAAALLVTSVGSGVFFGLWRPQEPEGREAVRSGVVSVAPVNGGEWEDFGEEIVVHVSGRVVHPGLVRVEASARVGDAILAAGGALPDALLGQINLAAPLVDGGQVMVPGPRGGWEADHGWEESGTGSSGQVNINLASARELENVPGLGPVLARRIVDFRDANGPFREVEDLLGVSGIGEKKLAGLRDHVVLP